MVRPVSESSQAPTALEAEVRAHVQQALQRVGLGRDEIPIQVVERLEQRARVPDQRLVVGRYLLIGELGRGGMGVVYEAWDPGIERRVAIKTIEPELVPEEEREEVIERFRRETKVVGRLHHPSIVTIFDSGNERTFDQGIGERVPVLYYYVMEYLEGQSLARLLRERHLLPEAEAVRIARDIAEALHLSHQAGIIHRDIKPSNIFLRDNLQAVLLDFGIAKTGSVNLTRQGQILGTPSYLAPERLREKEVAIDGRADIFSLGVLLFTMLTGEAPFVGEDVYEVIDKIAKESHPQLERGTPAGTLLSELIDRMLAKDPRDRYDTAGDAARALDQVLYLLSGERPTSIVSADYALPEIEAGEIVSIDEATPADDEDDTGRLDQPPSEETTSPKAPISGPLPVAAADDRVHPQPDLGDEDEGVQKKTTISPRPEEAPAGFGQDENTAEELPAQMAVKKPADQGPTDILPKAVESVRVADVLGTRPELALQRETREMKSSDRSAGPSPLPKLAAARAMPRVEPDRTTPAIPAYRTTVDGRPYRDHAPDNDETTDDETIADPSSSLLKAFGDERATEQLVRAERPVEAPDHRRPAPPRGRRSRIEASLVDEDDVVVKPAPLDALKPDEMPTQAGFQRGPDSPAAELVPPMSATSSPEVVRARGDSRVLDPAEAGGERTQGGALISEREDEDKKSAAVARRTIGAARGRPPSSAAAAANIQVRVTGRAFGSSPQDDRMRMLRRRGVMLLAGALASVGIGLMLGRMQRSSAGGDPSTGTGAPSPKVEPRASVRKIPGTDQIELARPRPPAELIADAEAAETSGQLDDAARLFQKAIDSTQEGAPLRARARLGLGDVMRAKGDTKSAIVQYRALIKIYGSSEEAQQAKVALSELGVAAEPPRRSRLVAPPPPEPRAPPKNEPAKREVIFKPDDAMTPDEQCTVLLRRYLQSPAEAVDAFEELRRKHPAAPCVFWNLGRKYEQLGRNRQALAAYKRYIELDPKASQRETIEKKKIPNLEAKLRQ